MNFHFSSQDATRFFSKIEKLATEAGCWIWTASLNHKGYGEFFLTPKILRAHRFSYLLHFGPFDSTMLVCHTCDLPRCVNPAHLFLGTPVDNATDMVRKGRHFNKTYPSLAKSAVLNEELVREIRKRVAGGCAQRALARELNVSSGTINEVITRKSWSNVI